MRHMIGKERHAHFSGRSGLRTIVRAVLLALALAAMPTATLQAQFGIPGLGSLVGGLLPKGPQVVVDPTAVAKLVTQLEQQIQQIQVARSQLQLNVDNMRKLAPFAFGQVINARLHPHEIRQFCLGCQAESTSTTSKGLTPAPPSADMNARAQEN